MEEMCKIHQISVVFFTILHYDFKSFFKTYNIWYKLNCVFQHPLSHDIVNIYSEHIYSNSSW